MTEAESAATLINAGIDMMMLSQPKALVERYVKHLKGHINKNRVYMSRLDDAVAKIISVKIAMGLVEGASIETEEEITTPQVHATTEYNDALQAVRESLVLLKNDNGLLPISRLGSSIEYVVFVGEKIINVGHFTHIQLFRNYDNIGLQNGGWSLRWQGFNGNDMWADANKVSSNASSILNAFEVFKNASSAKVPSNSLSSPCCIPTTVPSPTRLASTPTAIITSPL